MDLRLVLVVSIIFLALKTHKIWFADFSTSDRAQTPLRFARRGTKAEYQIFSSHHRTKRDREMRGR